MRTRHARTRVCVRSSKTQDKREHTSVTTAQRSANHFAPPVCSPTSALCTANTHTHTHARARAHTHILRPTHPHVQLRHAGTHATPVQENTHAHTSAVSGRKPIPKGVTVHSKTMIISMIAVHTVMKGWCGSIGHPRENSGTARTADF